MLDSNGCNTTASTAIAKLATQTDLRGKSALVIGPGPVGLRAAVLLAGEGCSVHLTSVPFELFGARFNSELAKRTLESGYIAAEKFGSRPTADSVGGIQVHSVSEAAALESLLDQIEVLVAAGPPGLCLLPLYSWSSRSNLKWLVDFNLTEPLGIEGIKPGDDFAEYNGKRALGALAIGNPKMIVHKTCIAKLFERNDLVLDTEGVYSIAKKLV
jgi:hypothetical protein